MHRCVVPFCPHTTSKFDEGTEWICTEHWPPVPRHLKRMLARAKRRRRFEAMVWGWVKNTAIERAYGIG